MASLADLPTDMISEILSRVAFRSCVDLFNAMETCKKVLEAAGTPPVLKSCNILCRYNRSLSGVGEQQFKTFLRRCELAGNADAMYGTVIGQLSLSAGQNAVRLVALMFLAVTRAGSRPARYIVGMFSLLDLSGLDIREVLRMLDGLRDAAEPVRQLRDSFTAIHNIEIGWWRVHTTRRNIFGYDHVGIREFRRTRNCRCRLKVPIAIYNAVGKFWFITPGVKSAYVLQKRNLCDVCYWAIESEAFRNLV